MSAELYAELEAAESAARRWKALARRLREQRDWARYERDSEIKRERERAEQLAAARESHARELMASATRYGEAIERLQRERDNLVARLAASTEVRNSILTELEQEQENSKTANHLVGWYMAERDEFRKDLAQERDAHAVTRALFEEFQRDVVSMDKEDRRERDAAARDLQTDRANVEVALEAMGARVRELEGALERTRSWLRGMSTEDRSAVIGDIGAVLAKGKP